MNLKQIKQFIKSNPWKLLIGSILLIVVIVSSFVISTTREEKRVEYVREMEQIQREISKNISEIQELRK